LYKEGFREIDTPLLHPFQGDSTARPILASAASHGGIQFALASSPELYLKKMLVSGFNKVFTVSKVFRDEEIDETHLMEFTSVEYYMAYVDYHYMMDFTEKLLKDIARATTGKKKLSFRGHQIDFGNMPWNRISVYESLTEYFNEDIFDLAYSDLVRVAESIGIVYNTPTSPGNVIIDMFEKLFMHTIIQPTFVYDFPRDASVMCYDITMAKAKRGNPKVLERFELYIAGMELANCYSELNDPEEQRIAFANFLSQRNKELKMDETFYHALQVGMPPASGVGFGIDRLIMIIAGADDINDVTPFSTYHEGLEDADLTGDCV
jgi:lysyl-tRNA synthetase class 2